MTIEERIERVEKQNRRLKWVVTALCVVGVSAFVAGQAAPEGVPDVIKAKKFEVINEVGLPVVALRSWDKLGGGIDTWNHQGQSLFAVGANDAGDGSVATFNAEGKELVHLSATEGGTGAVAVFDPTGRRRRGILITNP